MIKVMISDPDLFAREGIKQMLSTQAEFEIVCEASGLADTLHGLRQARPDVCVLEATLVRHSGLGFLREVKSTSCNTPLLVMSHCHERDIALRALRAGAAGYLPKNCSAEELSHALKTAAGRRPYVSDTICELIVESLVDGRPKRQHDKLTDTDFEIFCLMAEGIPVPRIAGMCKLSVAGVRARRSKIMVQMSFRNEAELVKYAVERKLIGHA
jgi:DNA-binding NarL/FixJ family response regulator